MTLSSAVSRIAARRASLSLKVNEPSWRAAGPAALRGARGLFFDADGDIEVKPGVPGGTACGRDGPRPYLLRSSELFLFLGASEGGGRVNRAGPGIEKEKGSKGRLRRPPPVYFFRPIMAASAAITTRARIATMIVEVSKPAVTRGSTVPTRCSATTVVLPVPSV